MRKFISTLILFISCGSGAARAEELPYRLDFTQTLEGADAEELRFIAQVAYGVSTMIDSWPWAETYLRGDWKIRFANLSDLPGLAPDADSAFDVDQDGHRRIVLAWDRLRHRLEYPTFLVFEHVVANLYRATMLGSDVPTGSERSHQINMEGIYLAWSEFRDSAVYDNLPPEVQTAVDARLSAHAAAAYPGLSPEQIKRLSCTSSLQGQPQ